MNAAAKDADTRSDAAIVYVTPRDAWNNMFHERIQPPG